MQRDNLLIDFKSIFTSERKQLIAKIEKVEFLLTKTQSSIKSLRDEYEEKSNYFFTSGVRLRQISENIKNNEDICVYLSDYLTLLKGYFRILEEGQND